MKSGNKIIYVMLIIAVSVITFSENLSAKQPSVSFQVFYDELSPYGEWVSYPNYGYVWIPDAGPDFVPYSTQGHWIMTDYGWTWVSDYQWGWAPFHYGRWSYDNNFGWFWVPDTEWGPCWVVWSRADGYYGWQPMEPGVSVSIVLGGAYHPHHDYWIFVHDRDIERPDISRYYVEQREHDRLIRNSRVINRTYVDNKRHTTYISGPPPDEVQRVTGHQIRPVTVQENNKPGQNFSNGQLRIYRPQVVKNNQNGHRPAPSRVMDVKDVKHASERNTVHQPQGTSSGNNRREQSHGTQPQQTRPEQRQPVKTPPQSPPHHTERRSNTTNPGDKPNKAVPQHQQQKPGMDNQQKRSNDVQPAQPSDNSRRENQPENVKPQERKVEPSQPANNTPKPAENKGRTEEPQRQVNPANQNKGGEQRQITHPPDNRKNEQHEENKDENRRR